MTHINDCTPGLNARVINSGVKRVVGKVGTIVEVKRSRRSATDPIREEITVDVPGHGNVVVGPGDIEVQPS